MSRRTLGRAAIVSLALGTGTIACTPSVDTGRVASAGDIGRKGPGDAARLAGQARAALARRDGAKAVRLAERAAAADPADAGYRLLLGQAYLSAGRFASAEATFRDATTLGPGDPRAALQLALAEIADGKIADARTRLVALDGKVSDGDLGLALALSGDRAHAIDMLAALVRSGKSDARSRQNLALALALDGRWREARGVAMQDVGPDRINDQIAGWAALASSNDPRAQVAALIGAKPVASDPGRPATLALASPVPASQVVFAPAAPVSPAPIVDIGAPAAPAPQMATLALAPPVIAAAMIHVADGGATVSPEIVARPAATPALLAAPKQAPRRSYVRLAVARRQPLTPGPILHAPTRGGWVVQLGAYARADALEAAWGKVSRLTPRLATFTPVSGRTRGAGGALVRLSLSGFGERREATLLCEQIKARGGACFVRAAGNDSPWRWARRDTGTRVAMAAATRVS